MRQSHASAIFLDGVAASFQAQKLNQIIMGFKNHGTGAHGMILEKLQSNTKAKP
jgi:hypothetical protein